MLYNIKLHKSEIAIYVLTALYPAHSAQWRNGSEPIVQSRDGGEYG